MIFVNEMLNLLQMLTKAGVFVTIKIAVKTFYGGNYEKN